MAFPVRIHRTEDELGIKFKAATSVDALSDKSSLLELELRLVEIAYDVSLTAARRALQIAKKDSRVDPRAFWVAAHHLFQFVNQLNGARFYIMNENATFARDLGISESSVEKIKSFYRRFPNVWQVDASISWNKYRENKVASG